MNIFKCKLKNIYFCEKIMINKITQAGNIFFTLFGAVALVGVMGTATMSVVKGPVTSMQSVTMKALVDNNMTAATMLLADTSLK